MLFALGPVVLLGLVAAVQPVAFWTSDPVAPGRTVLVYGDGFADCRSVELTRLTDGPVRNDLRDAGVPVAESFHLVPLQAGERAVKFLIPPEVRPGVFQAKVVTPGGSVTVAVNRPEILWVQGDLGRAASHGGVITAVGKCLSTEGGPSLLRIEGTNVTIDLRPTRAEPFILAGTLPADLRPGQYTLRAHGGRGGPAAWSKPIPLSISDPLPEPTRIIEVGRYGVQGEDSDDDTAGILRAVRDAAKGGGVVFFPRGRYLLSGPVELPPRVTLRGAGRSLTSLCWADTDTPPEALIRGHHHFAVEDLTIEAINYRHGIVSDQGSGAFGHVSIRRIRLTLNPYRGHLTPEEVDRRFRQALVASTGGGDSLRLGGENVEIVGSDVYGAGRCLSLSGCSGSRVLDNTFSNGRWGWYSVSGSDGLLFERNVIRGGDIMSTGGGLNCLDDSTVSQNVYFADNTLRTMYGWDREAMTTDGPGGAYVGTADHISGPRLTLSGMPEWGPRRWTGAGVFVVEGKGQGQYRQLRSASGRDLLLDAPWTVEPDRASVFSVTMLQRHYLFVNNRFEDAGVAIQLYGTAVGHIAIGNTSARTGGFNQFGMDYHGLQPSWYNQWLGNRITEGNVYGGGHDQTVLIGEAHLGIFSLLSDARPKAPLVLAAIIRDNRLDNNAHLSVGGSDPPIPDLQYPYVQDVVVEGNRVEEARYGMRIDRGVSGVLARENEFVRCGAGAVDDDALSRLAAASRARLTSDSRPLLHLSFDSAEGNVVRDETGHGFDARCDGRCEISPTGVKNGCLVLDGQSYLTVARPELLDLDTMTLCLWIKPDDPSGRWGLVSKRFGNTPAPAVLAIWDRKVVFDATDRRGEWSYGCSSGPLIDRGRWSHLAAVVSSGRGVTIYYNGRPVARKATSDHLIRNAEPLRLGRDSWGGTPPDRSRPACFKGSLDELEVWDRALSAREIADLATPPRAG